MRTRLALHFALLTTVILLAAACGGDQPIGGGGGGSEPASGQPGAAKVSGTIVADDQPGDGSSVMVSSVGINGTPGWVAIHSDASGKPGPVLGVGQIPEGSGGQPRGEARQAAHRDREGLADAPRR